AGRLPPADRHRSPRRAGGPGVCHGQSRRHPAGSLVHGREDHRASDVRLRSVRRGAGRHGPGAISGDAGAWNRTGQGLRVWPALDRPGIALATLSQSKRYAVPSRSYLSIKSDLHILPKFADRWAYLYLEHGWIDRDASSITFHDREGETPVPIDQLGVLMLGPGTSITHAAIECLAENNCLVCWVGEAGCRLYAHSTGGTHAAFRLLRQARLYADEATRIEVARRM